MKYRFIVYGAYDVVVIECDGKRVTLRLSDLLECWRRGGVDYLKELVRSYGFNERCKGLIVRDLMDTLNKMYIRVEGKELLKRRSSKRKHYIPEHYIEKASKALALRIDPMTAYRIYIDVLGGVERRELLIVNWPQLCNAWKLFDKFREEGNLSLLSQAYKALKSVPEIYMILAEWILNEKRASRRPGIVARLRRCLEKCVSSRMLSEVMECIDEALSAASLSVQDKYTLYEECRVMNY